jgi:hypothetical protein
MVCTMTMIQLFVRDVQGNFSDIGGKRLRRGREAIYDVLDSPYRLALISVPSQGSRQNIRLQLRRNAPKAQNAPPWLCLKFCLLWSLIDCFVWSSYSPTSLVAERRACLCLLLAASPLLPKVYSFERWHAKGKCTFASKDFVLFLRKKRRKG